MARLIVTALSGNVLAAPGNRQPCSIVVSVTGATGIPIALLGVSDFSVSAITGPIAFGVGVNTTGAVTVGPLGFYRIDVVPMSTVTWKKGAYIFAVVVKRGPNNGQTLATALIG